jgi:hypothetical protein
MYLCIRGIKPGESEQSCICVLGVSILHLSKIIFTLDLMTVRQYGSF